MVVKWESDDQVNELYRRFKLKAVELADLYSGKLGILLLSSILQLVHLSKSHRDQIFKDQVLTGNYVSNTKFRFV